MGGLLLNRSEQIRRIYLELKIVVGDQAKPRDLLRLAAAIVAANQPLDDFEDEPEFKDDRSLVNSSVDRAFADGGWGVLYFELRNGFPFDDEHEVTRLDGAIKRKRLTGQGK
jgi:hypothetical protein